MIVVPAKEYVIYSLDGEEICQGYGALFNNDLLRNDKFSGIVVRPERKVYFLNKKPHRLYGPAYEYTNGHDDENEYWLFGKHVKDCTQESFVLLCDILKLKGLT